MVVGTGTRDPGSACMAGNSTRGHTSQSCKWQKTSVQSLPIHPRLISALKRGVLDYNTCNYVVIQERIVLCALVLYYSIYPTSAVQPCLHSPRWSAPGVHGAGAEWEWSGQEDGAGGGGGEGCGAGGVPGCAARLSPLHRTLPLPDWAHPAPLG